MLVMLRGRQGPFRRAIRDAAGAVLRTYTFQVGESTEVDDADRAALDWDLQHALCEVTAEVADEPVVADAPEPPAASEDAPSQEAKGKPAPKAAAKKTSTRPKRGE